VSHRALVIGMGNPYRGDDGVGPVVADRVAQRLGVGLDAGATGVAATATGVAVEVLAGVADPLDLLGRWDDAELAVVIDASRTGVEGPTSASSDTLPAAGAGPGTIRMLEAADTTGSDDLGAGAAAGAAVTSTHGLGLVAALRLARALGAAPGRVVLLTVEGASFAYADRLSPAVAQAVEDAAHRVLDLLGVPVDAAPGS